MAIFVLYDAWADFLRKKKTMQLLKSQAFDTTWHLKMTSINMRIEHGSLCEWQFFFHPLAEPPKITAHPQELKGTVSGKPVSFTVQATGTKPLNYQWQWKPVVEGVHSGEWQNLTSGGSVQGADTATLIFTSIESCSEGLYRCVVTNDVGEEISEYTDHIIGELWSVVITATVQLCIQTLFNVVS